ncbi:MAG: metallophosphoesterase [Candidatus Izemoplasmatales bacterium]|nr:metallophosphoesterase [Candidatus Izemoplasmatales bacterium]
MIEIPSAFDESDESKSYFVFSDIHSQATMLFSALKEAGFDRENPHHYLLSLGDWTDRGLEGKALLDFLEEFIPSGRLLGVLGNHDQFLLDFADGNTSRVAFNIQHNGFKETLGIVADHPNDFHDFKRLIERFHDRYPHYLDWLYHLPLYLEFDHHVFVHGFLNFHLPNWRDTSKHDATWFLASEHLQFVPKDFSKQIVCGHETTYLYDYQVKTIDKVTMIDGGAGYGQRVHVLVFDESEL